MLLTKEKYKMIEKAANSVKIEGLRKVFNMKIGQICRQGDIYIHAVDKNHSHGEILKSHQLAVGITKGSRHIAGKKFKVYQGTTLPEWVSRGTFLGPCIVLEDADFELITHPEHANFALSKGTYQITHQMDLRTRKRVQD